MNAARLIALYLTIFLGCTVACLGQDFQELTESGPVSFTLKAKKTHFLPIEPVVIFATLVNKTDEIQRLPLARPQMLVYWFVLRDGEGKTYHQRRKYTSGGGLSISRLGNALSARQTVELTWDLRELVSFPASGDFRLQVIRIPKFVAVVGLEDAVWEGRTPKASGIVSNVISFTIE
jgi:hypothetical protein